jgi:hypothetical protein
MKFLLLTGLLTLGFIQGNAQSSSLSEKGCATITTPQEMQELAAYLANPQVKAKTTSGVDSIPLSLHIVSKTDGTGRYKLDFLLTVICQLNTRYAPVGFYFFVKWPIHFIKNDNYFVHDYWDGASMMNQNNVANTANIYFVDDPNGACGYFAPGPDGIAIAKNCANPNNTTVTHELGHYFGLPHTFFGWENGATPSNPEKVTRSAGANCSNTGDLFCDTDADYLSARWNCPYTGTKLDVNGTPYHPDSSLYMSYSVDACMSRFSNQQTGAMQNRLNGNRSYLLSGGPTGAATLSAPNVIYPGNLLYSNLKAVRWNKVPGAQAYYVKSGLQIGTSVRQDTITTDTTLQLNYPMVPGGYYSVTVIPLSDVNVCMGVQKRVDFIYTSATTSVANVNDMTSAVSLFPNPANNAVTLKLNADPGVYQIQVTNLNGQRVLEQTLNMGSMNGDLTFSTTQLPAGLYMVKVSGNNGTWTEKLVVQH